MCYFNMLVGKIIDHSVFYWLPTCYTNKKIVTIFCVF